MSEYTEQVALFEWAAWASGRAPELALLLHIPNGGHRRKGVAGQLKAAGVKAGVPDLLLPVARHGAHGLWIELKAGKGRASEAQQFWRAELLAQGYDAHVVTGWQAAARLLCQYLSLDADALGVALAASGRVEVTR